jgi:hypothetical protein
MGARTQDPLNRQNVTVVTQAISLKTLTENLIGQLNTVRVFPLAFVFLGKNFFEPLRLSLRRFLVHECGVMKDDKLLAALVTPHRAHLLGCWRLLSHLTHLDRYCFHRLTFYPDVRIAFAPCGLLVRDRNSLVLQGRCFPDETNRSWGVRDSVC